MGSRSGCPGPERADAWHETNLSRRAASHFEEEAARRDSPALGGARQSDAFSILQWTVARAASREEGGVAGGKAIVPAGQSRSFGALSAGSGAGFFRSAPIRPSAG